MTTRGERQSGSTTVTVAARGSLAEPAARSEAIALIGHAERAECRAPGPHQAQDQNQDQHQDRIDADHGADA